MSIPDGQPVHLGGVQVYLLTADLISLGFAIIWAFLSQSFNSLIAIASFYCFHYKF